MSGVAGLLIEDLKKGGGGETIVVLIKLLRCMAEGIRHFRDHYVVIMAVPSMWVGRGDKPPQNHVADSHARS